MSDKCTCRQPKTHSNCMYCGSNFNGEFICGVCSEAGIDGKVIKGTKRVICSKHKKNNKVEI
jgi:hypothetical protein